MTPIEYVEKIKNEFEEKFEIPWYKTYGYNLKYIKNFWLTSHITLLELLVEEEKGKMIKHDVSPGTHFASVGCDDCIFNSAKSDTITRLEEIIKKLKEQI